MSCQGFAYIDCIIHGCNGKLTVAKEQATRILVVTPEPVEGASSRLRAIDFIPYWQQQHSVEHLSFLSRRSYRLKDKRGQILAKIFSVMLDWISFLIRYPFALYRCDAVYVHRNIAPLGPPLLEGLAKLVGRHLVYDFDDAIYLNPATAVNQWLAPLKMNAYRTAALVKMADHVVVGNRYLARYGSRYSRRVSVIPTAVDLAAYADLQAARDLAEDDQKPDEIVIGWIGGPGTVGFVAQIWPALAQVLAAHDQLVLTLVGGALDHTHPQVRYKPWQLETELTDLASFDIGINPLEDNEFTRGKCGFKNIQYMAAGVVCVTSPVGVCADQVEAGVTGLFASNMDEWVEALTQLVEKPALREQLALNASTRLEQYDRSAAAAKVLALLTAGSEFV